MLSPETLSDLERRVRGLRRRLAVERAVFGTALLVAGSALAYPRFFVSGYTLAVGNRPLVAVADREAAERVVEAVKSSGIQETTDHRPPTTAERTTNHLGQSTPPDG